MTITRSGDLIGVSATVATTETDLAEAWAHSITDVTVICSSSRGGSSVAFRALSRSREILSPRGEETPFVRACISAVYGSPDDTVTDDAVTAAELAACRTELAADVSVGNSVRYTGDLDCYISDLARRLPLQWATLTPQTVERTVAELLELPASAGWRRGDEWDGVAVFKALVARLAADSLLDPRYYDRDPQLGDPISTETPEGPPTDARFLEEPPFIPILPRLRPTGDGPTGLLFKAPASVYRLDLLPVLFPRAKIKILHLVRNPASAVNGLIDGWHHWGFFSRNVADVGLSLDIPGYSDLFGWGKTWWNFDLPPRWPDYAAEPLERVCAYQWQAAHTATLDFVASRRPDYLRIAFEDLTGDPSVCRRVLSRAAEFAGVRDASTCANDLPGVVMSTVPPAPGRWRRRQDRILPLLARPDLRAVAGAIGYDTKDHATWT
jgi:hypothetical protein